MIKRKSDQENNDADNNDHDHDHGGSQGPFSSLTTVLLPTFWLFKAL